MKTLEFCKFFVSDEVVEYANIFEIPTVPVLWRGILTEDIYKDVFDMVNKIPGKFSEFKEGYVIRRIDSFHMINFSTHVAKYVSKKFKEEFDEDKHWRNQPVVWNKVKWQ